MDVSGPGGEQLQPMINFCACVIVYGGEISIYQESESKGLDAEFSGKKIKTFFVKCLCHWSRKLK